MESQTKKRVAGGRPVPTMFRFYLQLSKKVPAIVENSAGRWTLWVLTVLVSLVLLVNPEWKQMLEAEAFSRWFALIPIGIAVAYGLLRANYLRFRELYEALAQYEREDDIQDAIAALSALRIEAIDSLYAALVSSATDLAEWEQREEAWRNKVEGILKDSFSKPIVGGFTHLGELQAKRFEHAFSPDHNHMLRMIARRLEVLEGIIMKHAQLTPLAQ